MPDDEPSATENVSPLRCGILWYLKLPTIVDKLTRNRVGPIPEDERRSPKSFAFPRCREV
jgi:hypothetical protein